MSTEDPQRSGTSPDDGDWGLHGSWTPLNQRSVSGSSGPSGLDDDIDPFDIPLQRNPAASEGRRTGAGHGDQRFGSSPEPRRQPESNTYDENGYDDDDGELVVQVSSDRRARRNNEPAHLEQPRRRSSDFEAFPPRRRGRAFLGFLMTVALIAGGLLFGVKWYQRQLNPPGGPGAEIELAIPANTSTGGIAKLLDKNGVVANGTVFRYWSQLQGKGGFEAGKYKFRKNSTFTNALATLQNGPSVPNEQKLTIPEGFRIEQIGQRIEEKLPGRTSAKFIEAVKDARLRSTFQPTDVSTLEGFLFPETYTFGLEDDESVIASRMVETFDGVADSLNLGSSEQQVGITPYQTLIVASLVEREAKLDSDRAKIARVIYNRLRADMFLQIDATLIYALNNGSTRLLNEDLQLDSPYNSYTNKGLPPGPISNPGRASIEAALKPADGDWLYYVVTEPNGGHSFTASFKQHKRNIALAKERGLR